LLALLDSELARPAFEVVSRELPLVVHLAGHTLTTRPDRVDRVLGLDDAPDGLTVVLDYKTGRRTPNRWTGPRPDALQLAIYAAWRDPVPAGVAMVLLPLVMREHRKYHGLAARDDLIPNVRGPRDVGTGQSGAARWAAQLDEWRDVSARLASEYARGEASVDPMPGACDHCHLSLVCRVDRRTSDAGLPPDPTLDPSTEVDSTEDNTHRAVVP